MYSPQNFSDLLATLHSTTLDERNWEEFLQRVCEYTQAVHGFLICSSSNLGLTVLQHGGTRDMMDAQRIYNESRGAIDPFRLPLLRNPRLGLIDGDELVPDEEFRQTELYSAIIKPSGLRHLTILSLSVTPRRMEAISLWRTGDQGRMPEEQRSLLRLLMPHLQIALEVRQKIRGSQKHAENLQTMLDRTTSGVILLSSQGRIVHSNHLAEVILAAGSGVAIRKGRLCALDRATDATLQNLIQPSQLNRNQARGGAMLVERVGLDRRPLQVVATPMMASAEFPQSASMMVLITDPETEVSFPDNVLRGMYGLTPAETDVANAYLTGFNSEEIALLRGVSVSTVRSQLKVLLQKTSTKRQSDLLRLLMTLPRSTPFGPHDHRQNFNASPN